MDTVQEVLEEIITNESLTIEEIRELAREGRALLLKMSQEIHRIEGAIFNKEK